MDCNFNFHFLCGPLPFTVKYECHIHSLTLVDRLIEDDSDEYYIYYWEECKNVAHIHCVTPKIMTALKENNNKEDVELWALGESQWDLGVLQSNKDATKEYCVQHESLAVASAIESNSRFDANGSVEDIERLAHFFRFENADGENYLAELGRFYPAEGQMKLLDDKFLRQQLENVGGYVVLRTLAPVLGTIISDWGGRLELEIDRKARIWARLQNSSGRMQTCSSINPVVGAWGC
ncbi:hypothetical protein L484_020859 [Morus notabilis]|uniref:Uncharacterized protein n=1 Tax=Morus notabilis TaxID=981085 RepID=W9QP24_9ROSA|nr:hypothetical protein L484_020859 [Morus notabilis]